MSDSSRDQFDRDDTLRAELRAGDPARALAPADPAALARLLEDTMSSDQAARSDVPSRRGPMTWLAGAAAAAVVATAGIGAVVHLTGGGGSSPATAGHHGATAPPAKQSTGTTLPAVTRLTAPTVTGRCEAPTAALIAAATDTAFQGTVTSIKGTTVTLTTTSIYQGQVGQTVEVSAPAGLGPLVRSVHFAVGSSYLVSSSKGQVALCGFSGQAGGHLITLYAQAFPR